MAFARNCPRTDDGDEELYNLWIHPNSRPVATDISTGVSRQYLDMGSGLKVVMQLIRSNEIKQRELALFETYFSNLVGALLGSQTTRLFVLIMMYSLIAGSIKHG